MNNKILIAGATGQTGRIIVQKLLDRNVRPRILVRDEFSAQKLFSHRVDTSLGDIRQIESLLPAMSDVDVIISAVGSRTPVGKNCPKRLDYEGVANLVQAARMSGVHRFILISSIAVTQANHPMNCFGKVLDWKLEGENALRKSGLDYAIIRPGGLVDTPGGQKSLVFDQGDKILGTISRSDLAEICLCVLDHPGNMHLTFEVIQSENEGSNKCGEIFSSLKMDNVQGSANLSGV